MTTASAQEKLNRHARDCALQSVSRPLNLAAPTVSYQARGPILLLGPEHLLRLAGEHINGRVAFCALVTEAMPQSVTAEMEAAAAVEAESRLVRLPLRALTGYLGRFSAEVEVQGNAANLAKLEAGCDYFAAVLDLGAHPYNQAVLKPAGYQVLADPSQLADAVEAVVALQGEFEKPRYFTINNDLCAHSGSEMTGCTRCLDLCPADAIQSQAGQILIDAHLCHGAGGCASACPTSAIRYGYPQPQQTLDACRRLLKQYADSGGITGRLLIHDASFGAPWYRDQRDHIESGWLGLEVEELGAAGIELWLSALAWGAAEVVLLQPPELPDSIGQTLRRECGVANAMLEGMGLSARIRLLTPDQLVPLELPAGQAEVAIELAAGHDKRQQLSAAASFLFNHSPSTSGPHTRIALPSGAPYGQVALHHDRCTLCMACVAICPTSALSGASDTPELSFTEDACVQCGLCSQACPEDALQLVASYQLDPVPRQQPQLLKKEEPFCCVRCGKAFATQGAVALMLDKLAGHSMFADGALERLKMCGDCRVADLVISDPGADLFEYAKGREANAGEINLAQAQDAKR
ncbi:4Fe-4S binding protein [Motiliproteus sediminis]|uniref:4Fe-4S binding protein n=1 Tax=Motiliproteus sediminis TaxID=1468178 RepID=UPI001AEFB4BA|nr:4Fe-4S binding protein [Motiliproteus sediminis]